MHRICLTVEIGIKLLSFITLSIWVLFTLDTFLESSVLLFSLSCTGSALQLATSTTVLLSLGNRWSSRPGWLAHHPVPASLLTTAGLVLAAAITVLAHTSRPSWLTGGELAHQKVAILSVQLLVGSFCHALACGCFFCTKISSLKNVYVHSEGLARTPVALRHRQFYG